MNKNKKPVWMGLAFAVLLGSFLVRDVLKIEQIGSVSIGMISFTLSIITLTLMGVSIASQYSKQRDQHE